MVLEIQEDFAVEEELTIFHWDQRFRDCYYIAGRIYLRALDEDIFVYNMKGKFVSFIESCGVLCEIFERDHPDSGDGSWFLQQLASA